MTRNDFDWDQVRIFDYTPLISAPWTGHCPDAPYENCILCDRPVRTDRPHYKVEMIGGGVELVADVPEELQAALVETPGYMGCHVIGPYCRRKIPNGFAWKVPAIKS